MGRFNSRLKSSVLTIFRIISLRIIGIITLSLLRIDFVCGQDNSTLDKHLWQYEINFKSLMNYRSMPMWEAWNGAVTTKLLQSGIDRSAGYSDDNYFNYDRYDSLSKQYGLLLYFYEADTLFSYLLRPGKPYLSFMKSVSHDSLLYFEKELKELVFLENDKNLALHERGIQADTVERGLQYRDINKRLCDVLLPSALCKNLLGIKYLEIIPALNIGSIPFYLLQPYGNSSYVVDSMCVVISSDVPHYLYATKMYTNLGLHKAEFGSCIPKNPLIIGNPTISKCARGLQPLPGAESEAIAVAKILGAQPLLGLAARKDSVLQLIRESDFLYFATHAFVDHRNIMDSSFLLLADYNGNCGRWSPREIQSDSLLPGSIVVLSACESGMGKSMDAGVTGSLARSFILAGACCVIYSYWPVADQATSDFMLENMKQLQISRPFFPAEHLRQTILEYRKRNNDPQVWGAFTVLGVPYPCGFSSRLKVN